MAEITGSIDACGFLRLNNQTSPGFQKVEITLHVDTDASTEDLQDLVEHSAVFDVFTRPIDVCTTVRQTEALAA